MEGHLSALVTKWSWAKHRFEDSIPIDNPLLHLGIGFLIYWILSKIIPGRRAPLFSWLATLFAELANEAADLLVERWPNLLEQWGEGLHDVFWTLALPTVALLLTREPRSLFVATVNRARNQSFSTKGNLEETKPSSP